MNINPAYIDRTCIGARAFMVRALMLSLLILLAPLSSYSLSRPTPGATSGSDSITVSLVTCYPGAEIYELCGHEAIRIRGEALDSIWNYGIFDFNEPNFVYRFVKGETDYYVGGYPFSWFMPEYVARGSKVVEQDLNLTQKEARSIRAMLQRRSLPGNNRYRYNYIRNNCATRIVDDIDATLGEKISYHDSTLHRTYREAMRDYHRNYPWYQFGIDLVLGSGLDNPISPREEMFLPVEMSRHLASARMADGRPLVKASRVLYEGRDGAVLPPTPWYATPMAAALAVLIISVVVTVIDAYRRKLSKWWYTFYYLLLGTAGTLVAFLVFFSDHAATTPNIYIFWLNPLQLLIPILVWIKNARPVLRVLMWLNICIVVVMTVAWPLQHQSANPAIFPLMAADLVLAGAYAFSRPAPRRQPAQAPTAKKTNPRRSRATSKRK